MLSYKVRIYEKVKLIIPRKVQILLRRQLVRRQLAGCASVWPVYEPAKVPPPGWAGWPDRKEFALVLTHDVDSQKGFDNCLKLADVEEGLGLRSSFNFVARKYVVSPEVREELTERGFEVGVHGLYHTSRLYSSREEFLRQAPEINRVLREWKAVGFRSPSMYHNLEWMHDLDIEYDASTFDTDPFEPQPDGLHTIFPSFIPGREIGTVAMRKGYVELPYTLPQDSTLFILMQERTNDIWKKKLDWLVRNRGMVLVNAHPDYMSFNGRIDPYSEYDANLYREFLEHIKTVYRDRFWHPLPREIARFWADRAKVLPPESAPGARALNVCTVVYAPYETDTRVRHYCEALVERGDHVDVVALKNSGSPTYEVIKGVRVYRIQERVRNEHGRFSYLSRILRFLVNSAVFISKMHLQTRYDLVHVHSVPDFEVFAAMLPKLTGAKIILDIHDIVPEFYASKFNVSERHITYKALEFLEKISVLFSDHVIVSNHIWEKTLLGRSVRADKCTALLNYPDSSIFFRRPRASSDNGKPLFIYPGTLNRHQGLDIAIKAFAIACLRIPGAGFHIYGEGPELGALQKLVAALGLDEIVRFYPFLPLDQIVEIMAGATAAVVPKRNDPFGGDAFSTKVFEFMALGVPVILSKTRVDNFYFNDSLVQFFEPESCAGLAEALVLIGSNESKRQTLVKNALEFIEGLCWNRKQHDYYRLVDNLLGR
jgi:glycosyltransferase involved in cell wall biosynthesis/peptidoglycan/xylan/chitin deacetylase (PgdA/CDA1 family)